MKILLCSEFFFPSLGGAQEVTRQLAIRFAESGYNVTIATSKINLKSNNHIKNIKIKRFDISGNYVLGFSGNIHYYRSFVLSGKFDLVFIYAAQQWTFDALIDILPEIRFKKIFVPCGFSGLYNPLFSKYYSKVIPFALKHFDALIFHSKTYRDFKYAQNLKLKNLFLVPNGADKDEFKHLKSNFRKSFNIRKSSKVLLTVGTLNGLKGHFEVAKAFALSKHKSDMVLILNGNIPEQSSSFTKNIFLYFSNKIMWKHILSSHFIINFFNKVKKQNIFPFVNEINRGKFGQNKKVLILDLPRKDLIRCYVDSDLFVFASYIEYSPLVLFEAMAARLPFLTSDVGNAREIVQWANCGVVCNTRFSNVLNSNVDIVDLADKIDYLLDNKSKMNLLGKNGRKAHLKIFNWDYIYKAYEKIFTNLNAQ